MHGAYNVKFINTILYLLNPYPANLDNMASSYQCQQMADGI